VYEGGNEGHLQKKKQLNLPGKESLHALQVHVIKQAGGLECTDNCILVGGLVHTFIACAYQQLSCA